MTERVFTDNRKPLFTLIGGMMYDMEADLGKARRYWQRRYSGENYAYARLYEVVQDGRTYVPALYSKMPLCIFQFEDEAVAVRFQPAVGDRIQSVSVWNDSAGVHFGCSGNVTHPMKTKRTPHLGDWEHESKYTANIQSLPELSVTRGETWYQLVRQFVEAELSDWDGAVPSEQVRSILSMTNAFHDRIYDAINCLHVDTIQPDRPGRYDDHVYSFPSFEACRVMSLFRYSQANRKRSESVARRMVFDETLSAELKEIGAYRVWHNGYITPGKSHKLIGCTTFGTGYSGYPGGMGTFVRKLIEFAHVSGTTDLRPNLRQGADWLMLVQNEDGSFPYTVPSFNEISSVGQKTITGPNARALGGGAEAARALVWAFKAFGDSKYIEAAERAARAMNPRPPVYAFRGHGDLRDASAYETDATSGIQMASLNLELYEATGNAEYLKLAEIMACYLMSWHYWWRGGKIDPYGFIDPMAESFSPHVSPWNTSLACEMYSGLYRATRDSFWQKLAEFCFARASSLVNPATGGISEAYPVKMLEEITIMGGESGMVSWGILDAGCAILANRGEPFVKERQPFSSGEPVQAEFAAKVLLLTPTRTRPNPKALLRPLKPHLKQMIKKVLGPRGVARVAGRQVVFGNPKLEAPKAAVTTPVDFTASGTVRENVSFECEATGDVTRLRLAVLDHDTRIRYVRMPVIDFGRHITSAEPAVTVGKTITACWVTLSDGRKLLLEFLDGTTGLGVSELTVDGAKLACDVTLKAGWQFGGECIQNLRLVKVEG